jgi:hypothetical protein
MIGAIVATVTASQLREVELQLLLAYTQMFPEVDPKVTVIDAVP